MNIHCKTAAGYIKRSPFQALSAIFVLSLTFFVATMISVFVYSSGRMLKYFETRPQVIAFLKDDSTAESITALETSMSVDSRIKDIKYVPKEEALEIYKKATEDNPLLAELVSPSIFPASLEFSLTDLKNAQEVISQIQKEAIVESVGFTASLGDENSLGDVVDRLKTITNYVKIGGGVFVGILALSSFLVLTVIISMRISSRRSEVEILSLIGASRGFIKSPIFLEAIIYSFLGVLAGWTLSLIFWLYFTPSILKYFGTIPVLPKEPVLFFGLFGIIFVLEIISGLFLALIGATISLNRSFKKIR